MQQNDNISIVNNSNFTMESTYIRLADVLMIVLPTRCVKTLTDDTQKPSWIH